ncbi:MAG: acetylglutamate kinase [Firmicutes bacterium]|nr:acetylglutamate kinase [Bacillota bacterium]
MDKEKLMEQYKGKTILIKYGGNAMINDELKAAVVEDVVTLWKMGMRPILAHGGGPMINQMLEKVGAQVEFVNGLRKTTGEIIDVVEMVLIGKVNTELVGLINKAGGKAVGLSGVSGNMLICEKQKAEVDIGFVGNVVKVNTEAIDAILDAGFIPVIAPIGTDGKGQSFNINGDIAAGQVAGALKAEKFMLLTDIEGLCNDIKVKDVISYLNVKDVKALKDKGTIAGGMIPKVDCCVQAISEGVTSVNIIDGRRPHVILDAFTEKLGTTIGTAQESEGIKW